jgi:alpha-galactosidase
MIHFLLSSAFFATQQAYTAGLESLDLSNMTLGWGDVHTNQSVEGHPLTIGGKAFAHGVGTHAASEFTVRLSGQNIRFHSWVGVDDETEKKGSVDFQVFVDGIKKADSGVLHGGEPAKELRVDMNGAHSARLVVTDAGDGNDYDHADWADAYFVSPNPIQKISSVGAVHEPTMQIAHVDLNHTAIHGPRVIGCTPGYDFIFRIPASGQAPLSFSVKGLPDGIALMPGSGILRGKAPDEGEHRFWVTVSGPGGTDSRQITLVSGSHQLAQTPPMGWNSWNVWGTSVTAAKVKAAADSFESSHLADFGYMYVNIDDAWEGSRDIDGTIVPNEKFGDIADLATYVHGKGLKLGIYSSPGPKTCGGYEGSYQHEVQDAQTYAKWGIDYLKYDWCSFGNVPHPDGLEGYELPYNTMRAALDSAPRDIVFSLCQYGMGDVYKWGHSVVGGNLWRTTGDINDSWSSMSGIGFSHSIRSTYIHSGGWNDPDMLVVGRLGWGDHPRPTKLTGNEQITHISLWCMLAAPLILGCDLTQLDSFTKDLMMNPEVLDVDQDSLGKPATQRFQQGDLEVWARPLWDGSFAVGLFNRGISAAPVSTNFMRDLGVNRRMKVRDLWRRRDAGSSDRGYTATVPAHGTVLLKVW